MLVKELQSDFLIITNMNETARIEKLEGKFRVPKIMIGIILCIYSVYAYSKIYHYESAYLITAFFAGLYLSLRNIFSIFLERIKHKKQKKYYKQAERKVKREAVKRMDTLFAMLERQNPSLKNVSIYERSSVC